MNLSKWRHHLGWIWGLAQVVGLLMALGSAFWFSKIQHKNVGIDREIEKNQALGKLQNKGLPGSSVLMIPNPDLNTSSQTVHVSIQHRQFRWERKPGELVQRVPTSESWKWKSVYQNGVPLDLVKNDRGEQIGTFYIEVNDQDHYEFVFERGRGRKREIKHVPVIVTIQ